MAYVSQRVLDSPSPCRRTTSLGNVSSRSSGASSGSHKGLVPLPVDHARRDPFMGATIRKSFGSRFYLGRVVGVDSVAHTGERAYHVLYEDSDEEHLSAGEVQALMHRAHSQHASAAPTPRPSVSGLQMPPAMQWKGPGTAGPLLMAVASALAVTWALPLCWSSVNSVFSGFFSTENDRHAADEGLGVSPPLPPWVQEAVEEAAIGSRQALDSSRDWRAEAVTLEASFGIQEPLTQPPRPETASLPAAEVLLVKDLEDYDIALQALKVIISKSLKSAAASVMSLATPLLGGSAAAATSWTEEQSSLPSYDSPGLAEETEWSDTAITVAGLVVLVCIFALLRARTARAADQAKEAKKDPSLELSEQVSLHAAATPSRATPLRPERRSPRLQAMAERRSEMQPQAHFPRVEVGQCYVMQHGGAKFVVRADGAGQSPGTVSVTRYICSRPAGNKGKMTFRAGPGIEVPAQQLSLGPFAMKPGGQAPPHILQFMEEETHVAAAPAQVPMQAPAYESSRQQEARHLSAGEHFRWTSALERLKAMGLDDSAELRNVLNHYGGNVRLTLDHLMPAR